VDEILRVFEALQTADANAVATPANWKPGEPVIVPAPQTQEDAAKRVASSNGLDVKQWYFSKKQLAETAVRGVK